MSDTSVQNPGAKTTSGSLYELRGVTRSYSKGSVTVEALRGIDLDIASGEMLSLEGPSGSGKSTLLQLIGALDVPTSGQIRFAGRSLEHESDRVRLPAVQSHPDAERPGECRHRDGAERALTRT